VSRRGHCARTCQPSEKPRATPLYHLWWQRDAGVITQLCSTPQRALADFLGSWDDWVSQERIRKLTDENKELAANLRKDMDAQRRATSGKPSIASATKKRGLGSDAPGSSARGSEDRSSVAPPPPPRGTKRAREIEGIDKACHAHPIFLAMIPIPCVGRFLENFLTEGWI
jgi:hypothetical protein